MKIYFYLLFTLLLSCKKETYLNKQIIIPTNSIAVITPKQKVLREFEKNNWLEKDILIDTIPGISLQKFYKLYEGKDVQDTIIVAVLDSPLDINHEDLRDHIWVNTNEIPKNNIDDDDNGYIDDIYGWNFLGSDKGKQKKFTNYESTRILKKYDTIFKNIDHIDDVNSNSLNYKLYIKAKIKYEEQIKNAINDTVYANMIVNAYKSAENELAHFFPKKDYTIKSLDSLKEKISKRDVRLQNEILKMTNFLKHEFTEEYVHNYQIKAYATLNKLLNLNYNDRLITNDNSEDINDNKYGNSKVNLDIDFFNHSTIVSGIIGAVRNNNIGIDGVADAVKIMPVCISGYGEEHDKDIALGIRYAVDNGARVINLSIGKDLSMHKAWVDEAIQYAEKHNVLIVSSAGNVTKELDGTNEYPTDSNGKGTEVSSNFIHIGATNNRIDEKLTASFSNFSKSEVDIFAPGNNIETLLPNDKYHIDGGTSIASAVVSGVAALIMSRYPNLSASEVKEVILQSGTSYNINVRVKQEDGTKKQVPFSELSKSGKIVNAYNALLLAEKISNSK